MVDIISLLAQIVILIIRIFVLGLGLFTAGIILWFIETPFLAVPALILSLFNLDRIIDKFPVYEPSKLVFMIALISVSGREDARETIVEGDRYQNDNDYRRYSDARMHMLGI